jgi:hypothetical protein
MEIVVLQSLGIFARNFRNHRNNIDFVVFGKLNQFFDEPFFLLCSIHFLGSDVVEDVSTVLEGAVVETFSARVAASEIESVQNSHAFPKTRL